MWLEQFKAFDYSEIIVTINNRQAGRIDLGFFRLCSIGGVGGESPHGYVFRSSATPNALGQYPFGAHWDGYSHTMDLVVTCIN